MEYGDRIEKIGDNKVTGKTSDELEMMLKAIPAEVSSYAVPKRQNPVPLHFVKLRFRALKFLVHFSSVLPTKVPQKQSKVVRNKG